MNTQVKFILLDSNSQRMNSAITSISQLYEHYDRVLVIAEKRMYLEQIDELLWHNSSEQFITYSLDTECYSSSVAVLLTDKQPQGSRYPTLLNIDGDLPLNSGQFRNVIELVGAEEHYKEKARERYRVYRQLGFTVTHKLLGKNN
ncbi:MAG: DNA polymerase III subunit chi [Gammaproteobacteria bacterium]|nr:DNA polymerase III subunit chi [Gammaproteobacteria bacterium]